GIRVFHVTGVQTCALPILVARWRAAAPESIVALEAAMTMHLNNARLEEAEEVARAIAARQPDHEHARLRLLLGDVRRSPREAIRSAERRVGQESGYRWGRA